MDVPPATDRSTDPERVRVRPGAGRPAVVVAVAVAGFLAVALLKPWGSSSAPAVAVAGGSPITSLPPATDASTAPPSADATCEATGRAALYDVVISDPTTACHTGSPQVGSQRALLLGPLGSAVREGELGPGTYTYLDVDGQGFNLKFTVPLGWWWDGSSLRLGERGDEATIAFITGDVHLYPDPCH